MSGPVHVLLPQVLVWDMIRRPSQPDPPTVGHQAGHPHSRCSPPPPGPLPPQQHIAAHVPGEQDEEVIEIHSDGDGDAENRGGGT